MAVGGRFRSALAATTLLKLVKIIKLEAKLVMKVPRFLLLEGASHFINVLV